MNQSENQKLAGMRNGIFRRLKGINANICQIGTCVHLLSDKELKSFKKIEKQTKKILDKWDKRYISKRYGTK